ncbi:unnamed protein product [Ambrosiozyma monospora]|uniref:Unnamed protein product n=1 Tax=Ambrosiozyma monospora TaxID=43982 RepID=A0A9W6YSX7_AMBMO|nr:unnamed protein product [Ambrosiozyma monospora]
MATATKELIPFPLNLPQFKPVSIIPSSLADLRLSISPDQLTNSTNNIHEYINSLFQYTYDSLIRTNAISTEVSIVHLLTTAKSMSYIELDSKSLSVSLPWSNYGFAGNTTATHWSVFDEIMASVVSICLIYNYLTLQILNENYEQSKQHQLSDETWKKSNNLLKTSFSYLSVFKGAYEELQQQQQQKQQQQHLLSCVCNDLEDLHKSRFNYAYHLNSSLVQLIVIFKNIYVTTTEIESRFGDFDTVPDRVGTYMKVVVFIHNEWLIIKKLALSLASNNKESSLSPQRNVISTAKARLMFQTWDNFLQIIYCYYLALDNYSKQSLGIALGLIEFGLVNSIDQSPLKSKLLKHVPDPNSPSKPRLFNKLRPSGSFNSKSKSNTLKEKLIFMENTSLKREFENGNLLPSIFKHHLIMLVKLLKVLKVKLGKENDVLYFQKVAGVKEVQDRYLFGSSSNLPSGISVPLKNMSPFVPSCLKQFDGVSTTGVVNGYF